MFFCSLLHSNRTCMYIVSITRRAFIHPSSTNYPRKHKKALPQQMKKKPPHSLVIAPAPTRRAASSPCFAHQETVMRVRVVHFDYSD
jgi:hypothetical protein